MLILSFLVWIEVCKDQNPSRPVGGCCWSLTEHLKNWFNFTIFRHRGIHLERFPESFIIWKLNFAEILWISIFRLVWWSKNIFKTFIQTFQNLAYPYWLKILSIDQSQLSISAPASRSSFKNCWNSEPSIVPLPELLNSICLPST